ncbi:MAG: response regulator [Magnetococcales bacterium]|nr:response regulator [Magnetococcales bacterium]
MNARVLIVDDEIALCDTLRLILAQAGFESMIATSVSEAKTVLEGGLPNLILLDWLLKEISGLDFLRLLKREERTRGIPVIMLTAKGEESDKVQGLEQGADDYVTKPFSPQELLARIKAALRRIDPGSMTQDVIYDDLILHHAKQVITIRHHRLRCTAMEYRLLGFFMTHPDRVYYRDQLLDLVWGRDVHVNERTVDVHVGKLRHLLKPFGKDILLQTVRGAGYIFSINNN